MPLKVNIDAPPIRSADAARLMAHHLALAATYYEATPETTIQALAEIADVFDRNPMALTPARIWYESMVTAYEAEVRPAG